MVKRVHEKFLEVIEIKLGGQQAPIDQKTIGCVNTAFEVLVTDIEIKKRMLSLFKINQFAAISAPTHTPTEFINLIKGGNPIRFTTQVLLWLLDPCIDSLKNMTIAGWERSLSFMANAATKFSTTP